MGSASLTFCPVSHEICQSSSIGAEVNFPDETDTLNLDALSENDKGSLRKVLFNNQVIVIRNRMDIDPATFLHLTEVFDTTFTYILSAGGKSVSNCNNIISAYRAGRIPRAPQVSIIGSGRFDDYEGIDKLEVTHLIQNGYIRPYRWHMDTPFSERLPGEVTILHGVQVPQMPDQKLKFPDGTEKKIAANAMAFSSGARAFELLSNEEKEFALNTTVTYAPHAYEYIRQCKATDNGLFISCIGRDTNRRPVRVVLG
ncbi:Alpha-ketoglutarate dependent xanthine dioxygenase [Geosmithia morbida]|uniref:Alpha-ketoglutarate dependent xanthine dioxygenase n=1 Tax=Geosmithia morbida TaxID=1094350 RepID=A0A9P4Z0A8_9HYPO|nr:Alpha-ketoglutarate dependent xanthine dioxygenase [Geosmithia morbida]KAF4125335.1 Alpha-ketoglutarate dependent xanthine dioxygenase [Geosmithia morbida]